MMPTLTSTTDANASTTMRADVDNHLIVFDDVSKFYGDILGVNRVNLSIAPGITSLVGPNGSGKTTLMNLMTGLLQPTRGRIRILGTPSDAPETLFRKVGYCAQFDSFPPGMNGDEFVSAYLGLHGFTRGEVKRRTHEALERVGLLDAARRKVAGYSKGMRQRVRLAQSIAHNPQVLILDEPLNGLDPLARADSINLFRRLAAEGLHLIISSHILHEVDMMSDRVVLLKNGYVVAEGSSAQGVREEIHEQALQILVRCTQPARLAASLFASAHIIEARMLKDENTTSTNVANDTVTRTADSDRSAPGELLVRTRDADRFYLVLNKIVAEDGIEVESIAPFDDDLQAVYGYLIGAEGSK